MGLRRHFRKDADKASVWCYSFRSISSFVLRSQNSKAALSHESWFIIWFGRSRVDHPQSIPIYPRPFIRNLCSATFFELPNAFLFQKGHSNFKWCSAHWKIRVLLFSKEREARSIANPFIENRSARKTALIVCVLSERITEITFHHWRLCFNS